jgi:aspartyl-tRNA synthetase
VRAIKIEGGAEKFSRREIDALTTFVKTYRAGGLAWVKISDGAANASFAKFVSQETLSRVVEKTGAKNGDALFIVADKNSEIVLASLGALRCECARRTGAIDKNAVRLLWVTDFPMFEYSEEDGRYVAKHHPFTSPRDEDWDILERDPANVKAKAYDMVLNGFELGGGSIRIHKSELQARMFRALGFSDKELTSRFGHLIEAFRYGAPPHGGMAFGLDRLVMLLAGCESIRDTIAFPKVQNASELMMNSPDTVDEKQLKELHISLIEGKDAEIG